MTRGRYAASLAAMLIVSVTTGCSNGKAVAGDEQANVKIVKIRFVPFKMATNGQHARMILADWKNIGKVPVRLIRANIVVADGKGRTLDSCRDTALYR